MGTFSRLTATGTFGGCCRRVAAVVAVLLTCVGAPHDVSAYGVVQQGSQPGFSAPRFGPGAMLKSASLAGLQAQYIELAAVRLGVEYGSGAGWDNACTAGVINASLNTFRVSCHSIAPNGVEQYSFSGDVQAVPDTVTGCPVNSNAVDTSSCACTLGFNAVNGACVRSQACDVIAAANTAVGGTFQGGTFKSLTFCNGGCVLEATNGYGVAGDWSLTGTFTATGANCNGDGNGGTDVETTTGPLPAGKCPGTVNGVAVVVPCGTTVTKEETKTSSTATPASGASTTGTISNQTKTTTCDNGNCTTTTTTNTRNSDGSGGTSTEKKTEPKPQDSFCKENPTLQICKQSSIASSCAGGALSFSCDGDAVQCKIAQEQLRRQCEFFDKRSDASSLGEAAAVAGVGGDGDHPFRQVVTKDIGRFDQADLIGAPACLADRVIVMNAVTVTIPLSELCAPGLWLGRLFVAITALACVGIISRS